jgi:hypothetical protein
MRINRDHYNAIWLPLSQLSDFGVLIIESRHFEQIKVTGILRPSSTQSLEGKALYHMRARGIFASERWAEQVMYKRPYCPGTYCDNWDSHVPQYLTDKRTGLTIGRLMPRLDVALVSYPRDSLLGYQRHS